MVQMVRLFLRQFTSPIMLVLIGATILSIVLGERVDGALILVIVVASGLLGFLQEYRADRTMEELAAMVRIHADVRRGDQVVEVPVGEVVLGDIVVLRAGDIIPADLALTSTTGLLIDESAVTGESMPTEKGPGAPEAILPTDAAFFGTHVISGEGEGRVVALGEQTRFGALVQRMSHQDVTTSFERSMTRFGYLLTQVMVVLVAIVMVIQTLAHRPLFESLMFALALAVGITPQMLPAIVMVSLSAGARRMAREEVLIRRLDVIEDIGAMTILCADKTGTLTAGRVRLHQAIDGEGSASERVLRLAAANAGLQASYANALDTAILERAPAEGTLVAELPYDFQRRRLSVVVDLDGERLLISKGAVEEILASCAGVDVAAVRERVRRLGQAGERVIAVASRPFAGAHLTRDDETGLAFEGLVTFLDPPTEAAGAAVARLRELGVEVAVISGDNRHVTTTVAHSVGVDGGRCLVGSEIDVMDEAALAAAVADTRIYAEIGPLQKERIVRALQAQRHTVGFLGDGINDVAALRRADVGVSVESAADVAKQSAAIVVMTKDLDVIIDAVLMGRRTFANTIKYVRVTISANFGNMISMVAASLFLPFLPMLPVQILLLNLLSDAPALAIAGDDVDDEDLARPHYWSIRGIRRFMIVYGVISSIFDISAFVLLRGWLGVDAETFHTAWFLLSLLTEVIALLVLRTRVTILRSRPGRGLAWISVATIVTGWGLVATGVGSGLGLIAIDLAVFLVVALLGLAYLVTNEVAKRRLGLEPGATYAVGHERAQSLR
jgi:Mg2+-importing ATPase